MEKAEEKLAETIELLVREHSLDILCMCGIGNPIDERRQAHTNGQNAIWMRELLIRHERLAPNNVYAHNDYVILIMKANLVATLVFKNSTERIQA